MNNKSVKKLCQGGLNPKSDDALRDCLKPYLEEERRREVQDLEDRLECAHQKAIEDQTTIDYLWDAIMMIDREHDRDNERLARLSTLNEQLRRENNRLNMLLMERTFQGTLVARYNPE